MKQASEILQTLQKQFPDTIVKSSTEALQPFVVVAPEAVAEVCAFLKSDPNLAFDSLMCLSGVDFKGSKTEPERLEVVYHLFSMQHRHKVVVKVELPRENPVLPTVEEVWAIANWHEREAYDMYGIRFEGHSDLRRILCPDDWVDYPLRKDYVEPETYRGMPAAATKQFAERAQEGEDLGTDPYRAG
jgi:NADH-quinone oxidoreductase subunit C